MTLTLQLLREIDQRHAALNIATPPENAVIAKLRTSRRLSAATVETFGIQPHKFANQWGWKYATSAGGQRWKNANSEAQPKYAWIDNPAGPPLYHANDLLESIAQTGGVIW